MILGGGGDLSKRKLLPALFDLFCRGMLPKRFRIIGLARSPRSDEEYRTFVKETVSKRRECATCGGEERVDEFCEHISYVSGSFDDAETYNKLKSEIESFDQKNNSTSNLLFYLAVPPKYYGQIFSDLKKNGLADRKGNTWVHLLVEKPFGNNLVTAQTLDAELAELYDEDQIFRIDHYLAKEAVQDILSFRFANSIMQASWNKDSIESVTITMTETIDVGDRLNFYEGVGALRDVGQNHLLQLLALVAMPEPAKFTTEAIREARVKALQALKPIDVNALSNNVLRAQYDGYKIDTSVPNDSETETYFELKAEVDLPEWSGVPFYIRAGKALTDDEVSIRIKFKDVATGMFETKSCFSVGNEILLRISPQIQTSITLNAKQPGLGFQLRTRNLSFTVASLEGEIKNSYEKVLYDSIVGDRTLFTKTEEVLAAWRFITPILESWQETPLYTYEKGSSGPEVSIIPK